MKNSMYFCSANFFFMSIMCCLFSQLQSMDGPAFDMKADALKIALMTRPDRFDRKMIRCLSEVSVGYSKAIRETVKYRELYNKDYRVWVLNSDSESRKQHFMDLEPRLKFIEGLVWNSFGTAYTKASFGSQLNWSLYEGARPKRFFSGEREVMLERCCCLNSDFVGNCAFWENFYDVLPHQPSVSFDGKYDVYVHACGAETKQDHFGIDVLEYRLSCVHGSITSVCMAEINGDMFPLAIFLEFPKLLKAFLSSSAIQWTIDVISSKIFMLKGVVLPADYEECKPYHEQVRHYTSFEKLPEAIRDSLRAHYRPQSEEVKKKKGGCFFACFGA